MRLQRVVDDDLGSILGLDDHICPREPALEVAPLVVGHVRDERLLPHRLVRVEQRLEHVPFHHDALRGCLCLAERVGGDGRHGVADVARLVRQLVEVGGSDHGAYPESATRGLQVDRDHTCARVRTAQDSSVQHPRKLQVGREQRLTARPRQSVDARHPLAHRRERSCGPPVERVLVDDDPDFLVAAFDFLLGADQSCQVLIASSIFGYVPQRQRFPDIACWISSLDGLGFAATSAAAETTWPGVQKPHCTASVRTNA